MNRSTSNAIQGVAAVIGITLGAIPLVTVLIFDGGPGLWTRVLPDNFSPAWLIPLITLTICIAAIVIFSRASNDKK